MKKPVSILLTAMLISTVLFISACSGGTKTTPTTQQKITTPGGNQTTAKPSETQKPAANPAVDRNTRIKNLYAFLKYLPASAYDINYGNANVSTYFIEDDMFIYFTDGKSIQKFNKDTGVKSLVTDTRLLKVTSLKIDNNNLYYFNVPQDKVSPELLKFNLKTNESDGKSSGTMDDRWVFTNRDIWLDYHILQLL